MERTIGRLFRAVCAQDGARTAEELRAPHWRSTQAIRNTVDAAIYHGIVPLLAEALLEIDVQGSLRAEVLKAYRTQTASVLRLEALLVNAVAAFGASGIPLATFKGAALAHGYYAKAAQRCYVDVDLLIEAHNLSRADVTLRAMGCLPAEPHWQQAVSEGYGEVFYRAPSGAALDLHWHPIREAAVRRAFTLNTADLLERAQITQIADVGVPVLDAEDMLVAVAAHACYDGAYRLGWLVDVAQLEQSSQMRWSVLAGRCAQSGLGLPIQVVLDRARHTLGYVAPHGALRRNPWRVLTGALTAARGAEHSFGQVGRGGVLYRSTRRALPDSLSTLTRLAVSEVAKPVLRDPAHRWRRTRALRDRPHSG